jgi:prepilin-type N-terminal cleavage/methylation domain-containing protein/prepilin-type processing-associated H-X9-DG protein
MRRGFTLVELLVVIAIIALLAALLFPVFAGAKERSHSASCASNLKQIGSAFHLYLEDWDDYLPMTSMNILPNFLGIYCQKQGQGVWLCPNDPFLDLSDWEKIWTHDFPKSIYSSYSEDINFDFYSTNEKCQWDQLIAYPRSISSVPRPSSTIMVTEGTIYGFPRYSSASYLRDLYNGKWDSPISGVNFTGLRHQKRSNYLFADGHVKLLTLRQTLTPEVLWDNIGEWCPGCTCTTIAWTPKDIQQTLKELDEAHYP